MIQMSIVIRVKPEKRKEFIMALCAIQDSKKAEKGISESTVYQDVTDDASFIIVDDWVSEEALQSYLGGEIFRVLCGAFKTLCTGVKVTYSTALEIERAIPHHYKMLPIHWVNWAEMGFQE